MLKNFCSFSQEYLYQHLAVIVFRQQTESFDYQNTMKNRSIIEQLKVQKKNIQSNKRKNRNRVLDIDIILPPNNKKIFSAYLSFGGKNERILSISPILSKASYLANHEEQPPKSEKKKRKVKRKKFQ